MGESRCGDGASEEVATIRHSEIRIGLSLKINRAIGEAHHERVLPIASLMVSAGRLRMPC